MANTKVDIKSREYDLRNKPLTIIRLMIKTTESISQFSESLFFPTWIHCCVFTHSQACSHPPAWCIVSKQLSVTVCTKDAHSKNSTFCHFFFAPCCKTPTRSHLHCHPLSRPFNKENDIHRPNIQLSPKWSPEWLDWKKWQDEHHIHVKKSMKKYPYAHIAQKTMMRRRQRSPNSSQSSCGKMRPMRNLPTRRRWRNTKVLARSSTTSSTVDGGFENWFKMLWDEWMLLSDIVKQTMLSNHCPNKNCNIVFHFEDWVVSVRAYSQFMCNC